MQTLESLVHFISGSAQFRIIETDDPLAPIYIPYAQQHLTADLSSIAAEGENKIIRTFDEVGILEAGDIVFSLISGSAAMVSTAHAGYLQTHNYLKIVPPPQIVPQFLVYLLNEDPSIRRQLALSLQGSSVLKYTLAQLKNLLIHRLPPCEKQNAIGNIYLMQLQRQALKQRVAAQETTFVMALIKENISHE